jgi:recombination protein U
MADKKNGSGIGKIFEAEIKASIPSDFYVERYKDDTSGFYGVSNPADFRLYKYPLTFLWELKSHKGKSLPLAKIRNSQLKGMEKANTHKGIYCGFILNFRDIEETYYITFSELVAEYYIKDTKGEFVIKPDGRKSIPVDWCREYGVKIAQTKKRVRYSYDLAEWFRRYFIDG